MVKNIKPLPHQLIIHALVDIVAVSLNLAAEIQITLMIWFQMVDQHSLLIALNVTREYMNGVGKVKRRDNNGIKL